MRVYHERLRVPLSWWLLGAMSLIILGAELAAGGDWLTVAVLCLALGIPAAALLMVWGHAAVEVTAGELRAGRSRLPLAAIGQVAALDQAQTRAMRGPRADPAAFVRSRPYLREAVYIEVSDPGPGPASAPRQRARHGGWAALRPSPVPAGPPADVPYWLLGTRHPEDLATAIERSRPGARAGEAAMG